jgi:hypothetical protein
MSTKLCVQNEIRAFGTMAHRLSGLVTEISHIAATFHAAISTDNRDYIGALSPLVFQPDRVSARASRARVNAASETLADGAAAEGQADKEGAPAEAPTAEGAAAGEARASAEGQAAVAASDAMAGQDAAAAQEGEVEPSALPWRSPVSLEPDMSGLLMARDGLGGMGMGMGMPPFSMLARGGPGGTRGGGGSVEMPRSMMQALGVPVSGDQVRCCNQLNDPYLC